MEDFGARTMGVKLEVKLLGRHCEEQQQQQQKEQ